MNFHYRIINFQIFKYENEKKIRKWDKIREKRRVICWREDKRKEEKNKSKKKHKTQTFFNEKQSKYYLS